MKIRFCLSCCIGALCLWGIVGCTPLSEAEQEYYQQKEKEQEDRDTFGERIELEIEEDKMITEVQEYLPEKEGAQLQKNWVKDQINKDKLAGAVIYERKGKWAAFKKPDDKYEIRYIYTLRNTDGAIQKKGFSWIKDNSVDKIVGPRIMNAGELGTKGSLRQQNLQAKRRRNLAEETLE